MQSERHTLMNAMETIHHNSTGLGIGCLCSEGEHYNIH